MAGVPNWTYGHAWFTFELCKRARPFWSHDHRPFWTDDEAPFWDAAHGVSYRDDFPPPLPDLACPPGNEAAEERLRRAVEPREDLAVTALAWNQERCGFVDPDEPTRCDFGIQRIALVMDLGCNNAILLARIDALREAHGIRERLKSRGGLSSHPPWGSLTPKLAVAAYDAWKEGNKNLDEFLRKNQNVLDAAHELGPPALRAKLIRRAKKIDNLIMSNPYAAYGYSSE